MTTLWFLQDLKTDEGLRLEAYPDPVAGWALPTIGYGHTGRDVYQGQTWTQAQADFAISLDAQHADAFCRGEIDFYFALNDPRRDVLANMAFNMGARLLGFKEALAAMDAGDWAAAHDQLIDSDWGEHSPPGVEKRAARLARQMLTGQRIDPLTFVWPDPPAGAA